MIEAMNRSPVARGAGHFGAVEMIVMQPPVDTLLPSLRSP